MRRASADIVQLLQHAIVAFAPSPYDLPYIFDWALVLGAKAVAHQHQLPRDQAMLIKWSTVCGGWKSSWLCGNGKQSKCIQTFVLMPPLVSIS